MNLADGTEITPEELKAKLIAHVKYLQDEPGGRRLVLISANLSYANLSYANLSYANLRDADLRDADLRYANLRDANLRDANLVRANLRDANLEDANLRELLKVENLFTKIHESVEADKGGLDMSTWYNSCETVHCIAGWSIVHAGPAGKTAEALLGPNVAGALIINYSCPYLEGRVPNFLASDEEGMKFIKLCAAREKELSNGR